MSGGTKLNFLEEVSSFFLLLGETWIIDFLAQRKKNTFSDPAKE